MGLRKSAILATATFWGLVLMGTQILGTTKDIKIPKHILVQIKKTEDKAELERACLENNHLLLNSPNLPERYYLIEVPHNASEKIVDAYKELSFIDSAIFKNYSRGIVRYRLPSTELLQLEAEVDLEALQLFMDQFNPIRLRHIDWQRNSSTR